MLRSILAVLGGFATMAILVMVTTAIAAATLIPGGMQAMMTPGAPLPRRYLSTNLACSALAAFVGGFVTVRLAPDKPFWHGIALALLMSVMSVISARQARDRQPRWYQVLLGTLMPLIALAGTSLAIRLTGAH